MWRYALNVSTATRGLLCRQQSAITRRGIASAAFATNITRLQKEVALSEKKRELQQEGRLIFEREVLDDAFTGGLNPQIASSIAGAASALRIVPSKGQVFSRLITWALQPDVVSSMDGVAIGRLVHACVVLAEPKLFEVLFTYLWRVVELAPTLGGVSCAMIVNAYGRSGVQHGELYKALCARAQTVLREDAITPAHLANVANALSRVHVADAGVFDLIRDQSLRLQQQGVPLVWATILDAFSTVGRIDEELFTAFESSLEKQIQECSAPLMATILCTLAKSKRTQSPLFNACATRAVQIAHTYDAGSIAKSLDAFYQVKQCPEEFFGSMAERACKVATDFRTDEVRLVLRALSAFDLFDAELYPLLASRLISVAKMTRSLPPQDAIGALSSFAVVHERHDELIYTVSVVMKGGLEALDKAQFTELLWAFAELNVRNDTTRTMVSMASGRLLPRGQDELTDKRLAVVKQVFGAE